MAIDLEALRAYIRDGQNGSDVTWRDIAGSLKLKIVAAHLSNGITSYTINGRSVQKANLAELNEAYAQALKYASIEESGGISTAPISFRAPTGRMLL